MSWVLLCHRSELAKDGDYVLLTAGSEQALAYNHNGTVIVTDNRCLHRGARVFNGTHGNAPLKCPYHGFQDESVLKAQELTQWVGDWLFAGDGSTKLENELDAIGPVLAGISEKIGKRHAFDSFPMPCDWKVAVENALEDLHVGSVHPDTFGKLDLKLKEMRRHGRNSVAMYDIGDARTVKGLTAMSKAFVDVDPSAYFHILLYPNTCISSVGGFSYSVQHYLPNGGFTQLHTRLYRGKMRADAPNISYFFDEAVGFNKTVFAQDSAICARVQGDGTYLTEKEKRITWFRESRS